MTDAYPTHASRDTAHALCGADPYSNEFVELAAELRTLRASIIEHWQRLSRQYPNILDANRESAENLVEYLAFRCHDVRDLQDRLAAHGISSLGRSESHLMWNINKAVELLDRLAGRTGDLPPDCETDLSLERGTRILKRNTDALLGRRPEDRRVRIMVTLPPQAGQDLQLVRKLIEGGMDVARINCAHDDREIWTGMAANVIRARSDVGRQCRLCFDIPGPKLRTGHFEPGPQLVKWRPERDVFGVVTHPARIWCTSNEQDADPPGEPAALRITFPLKFVVNLRVGDKLTFVDVRGRPRSVRVVERAAGGVWLEARRTAYVVPGTVFRIRRAAGRAGPRAAVVGPLPAIEQFVRVFAGDRLVLTRSQELGTLPVYDGEGEVLRPAVVPCTLPQVFDQVKGGEAIWFDDGKVGGVIEAVRGDEIAIRVTHAPAKGYRLRGDKGINLPDSDLTLPPLTAADREVLRFAVDRADLIGYSFVRRADDIRELQRELVQLGRSDIGVILKIEARTGFEHLPELLLASMENPVCGIMIARGDLAVEVGFERLAEVQEEILWMCEAAHMPVIWATQVLEQLSKKGVSSRAEMTDAAMSERAECVMLNKGDHVVDAVMALDDVLRRMQSHQAKKRALMRPLKLAKRFFADT